MHWFSLHQGIIDYNKQEACNLLDILLICEAQCHHQILWNNFYPDPHRFRPCNYKGLYNLAHPVNIHIRLL